MRSATCSHACWNTSSANRLVSHEPQQVAEQAVLVPVHQPGEPVRVAASQSSGVVLVRIHPAPSRCGLSTLTTGETQRRTQPPAGYCVRATSSVPDSRVGPKFTIQNL